MQLGKRRIDLEVWVSMSTLSLRGSSLSSGKIHVGVSKSLWERTSLLMFLKGAHSRDTTSFRLVSCGYNKVDNNSFSSRTGR